MRPRSSSSGGACISAPVEASAPRRERRDRTAGGASGARSVERLTALFEEAKFSPHDVDRGMKNEAIDALAALRDELRAAKAAAAPVPVPVPA